ncbi:MAG: oxygenase MpaB family protein [Steroidobacter sp.]
MEPIFIERRSIVRAIWGDPDLVLLIFAGAAAEFALNRAVDWLFFTNVLPQNPIGRLFSTVRYAQRIIFASEAQAHDTLASIAAIHAAVERRRGQRIPDWAHRAVLYLLIDYSERAHRLLHGRLSPAEQESLYAGFLRVGERLHITQLPETFAQWRQDRRRCLERDLVYSDYTKRLFEQYRLHLGPWRYQILLEVQAMLAPARVRELLRLEPKRMLMAPCLQVYSLIGHLGLQTPVQRALIPQEYWDELEKLKPPAGLGAGRHGYLS